MVRVDRRAEYVMTVNKGVVITLERRGLASGNRLGARKGFATIYIGERDLLVMSGLGGLGGNVEQI